MPNLREPVQPFFSYLRMDAQSPGTGAAPFFYLRMDAQLPGTGADISPLPHQNCTS